MSEFTTKSECRANVKIMTDKINDLKEHVGDKLHDLDLSIAKLPEKLRVEFDKRYADKKTEKTMDRLTWLILAGVAVGVLNLVLK